LETQVVGSHKRFSASVAILALLSACGGGGGGGGGGSDPIVIAPPTTPTPPPTSACTLRARQDFAFAQINQNYLFPESIAQGVNPANFNSVQAYIDALVAPARAENKDRGFTFVTSIAQENALAQTGASAGFGVRLSSDAAARRVFVSEAFEGAPALAAGIDRGTEIIAIGTGPGDLRTVDAIIASEGVGGVTNALGPTTAGTSRLLRVRGLDGTTRDVTITKTVFALDPVSDRYGARILDDDGRKVGYVNLRTFSVQSAEQDLRAAFSQFKAQGITNAIVDLRYNGGGFVYLAELLNNLLLNKPAGTVMGYTTFRASRAGNNQTSFFTPQPESISSMKIAFIGTRSSASASELVMNAALPYLGPNAALIGENTFGKPVGQEAFDNASCDDRMRVLSFRTENASRQGDYFNGLASKFQSTCRAVDDVSKQLGDPQEAMIKVSLDFLAGRPCASAITSGGLTTQAVRETSTPELVTPAAPNTVQREIPGFF
jgi:C-terminal processing protease CtpA/Prc